MKRFLTGIVFIACLILSSDLAAQKNILQYSGTLYDAYENPQRQLFTDTCKKWAWNLPLPFPLPVPTTSLIDFTFRGDANEPLIGFIFTENLDPYLENLKNGKPFTNRLMAGNTVSPFLLKFRTSKKNKAEVSLGFQQKTYGQFTFKNEFANFYFRGNNPFAGEELKGVFDTKTFVTSYTEYSLGYRRNWSARLAGGIKLSLINGLVNLRGDVENSSLYTDDSLEYIDVSLHGRFSTSFDLDHPDFSQLMDDYRNFRNLGLGVSAGITYQLTEKLSADLAVKDLGFINWGKKTGRTYTLDKTLHYTGVPAKQSKKLLDSIVNTLTDYSTDTTYGKYQTSLPTTVEIIINYNLSKFFRPTLVITNEVEFADVNFAFIGDLKLLGPIHIIGMASYNTNNFYSLGGQFLIRSRGLDLYVGSEKLLNTIDLMQSSLASDVDFPLGADINMGLAYKFGRCPKVKESPVSPKDSDNDGLLDIIDDCPFIPGPRENKGCPIPDLDNDGVTDSLDDCPDVPGAIENKGCPIVDTDDDGVLDTLDKCPTIKGPVENNGCPYEDTDGDGVLDKDDKCPIVKGPISNNGCPYEDSDGDGIPDENDKCPTVPGTIENNGCPEPKKAELTKEEQEVINKVFDNLTFETGKTIIKTSSYESLNRLHELLVQKPAFKLLVEGHTDNTGSLALNNKLSQGRANAVKKYLAGKGIDERRIIAVGYGPTRPAADNSTVEGRAKNRRVEFTVLE